MVRLFAIVTLITLLAPLPVIAENTTPHNHSVVRIVFIAPYDHNPMMGQVDSDGNPVLMANVGNKIVPFDSVRPVSIKIDGDFVGHAMFGHGKVSPVYILPSGKRKLTFSCDGFKTVNQEIRVLGTGSTQYLIVKLVNDTTATKSDAISRTKTGG